MSQKSIISTEKPHFELLDGLRGVAALFVIIYHFFEGFATSPINQIFNHGYLAVDFFFVLSGFVLGYAYDSRLNSSMTTWQFIKKRIIRLHPMLILSVLFGAIAYLLQGSTMWNGTHVAFKYVILSLILGLFLIPAIPNTKMEIRGNGEMFPLNGPSWTLFFEYIGSLLYALILHKLNKKALSTVVIISAICLSTIGFMNFTGFNYLGIGWSMGDLGFIGGFCRLSFSFSAGILLSRCFKKREIRGSFWICSLLIAVALSCPYIGNGTPSSLNTIYELFCILFLFPAIVYIGACGKTQKGIYKTICNFIGNISYPIYIIHYPIMYLFYSWVWQHNYSFSEVWQVCVILLFVIIAMAWAALKFYDTPVRKFLSRKFL